MRERTHTSIIWIPVAENAGMCLPALVLSDGQIPGLVIEYALELLRHSSVATVSARIRSIALIFDFHSAMYGDRLPLEEEQGRFLSLFARAIQNGTAAPDGTDPMGLMWRARPIRRARRIIERCAHFINFAASQPKVGDLTGFSWVIQQVLDEAEWRRGRFAAYSLLAHLRRSSNQRSPWSGGATMFTGNRRRAIGFPPDKIVPLIAATLGNTRATKAARVRDALALILLAYGGMRCSELFHIWVNDISINAPSARVFLRHPSEFKSKIGRRRVTRQAVLAEQFGLHPRHLLPPGDRLRAGWKGMSSDYDFSALVYWIEPGAGVLFAELHKVWMNQLRPSAPDHPYYFTNLDKDGDFGGPWTIAAFRDAFRSACSRVGLSADQAGGICPHGLRHAYGLAAEAMHLPSSVIQEMLHHISPLSQEIYKQKHPEQVGKIIDTASQRIRSGDLLAPTSEEQYWLSDPQKLFNNWRRG